LRRQDGDWQNHLLLDAPFPISSFGEDEAGEIYLADYRNGAIYRLTDLQQLWLPVWLRP